MENINRPDNPSWVKYLAVAMVLHGAFLALPAIKNKTFEQKSIDVSIVAEPALPAPVREEQKPAPKPLTKPLEPPKIREKKSSPLTKPEGEKTAETPQKIVSPDAKPGPEVAQVGPGTGGVAIVGATGTGATLSGSAGEPGGAGAGLGKRGVGGGTGGPIDAEFGMGDGPQWVYQARPEYPAVALRLGRRGKVVVRLHLDEKGSLTKTDVMDGSDPMFVSAVLDALKKSKFRPARVNGVPVACRANLPVHFGPKE